MKLYRVEVQGDNTIIYYTIYAKNEERAKKMALKDAKLFNKNREPKVIRIKEIKKECIVDVV